METGLRSATGQHAPSLQDRLRLCHLLRSLRDDLAKPPTCRARQVEPATKTTSKQSRDSAAVGSQPIPGSQRSRSLAVAADLFNLIRTQLGNHRGTGDRIQGVKLVMDVLHGKLDLFVLAPPG